MPIGASPEDLLALATIRVIKRREAKQARPLGAYMYDPVAFANDCIDWGKSTGLTDYQEKISSELIEFKRVAERGPHGVGKTAMVAVLVIWFSLTREDAGVDWKCITTASAWRQLTHFLWPEIRKWMYKVRWEKIGRERPSPHELKRLSLDLMHGEAFAVASKEPALIEGAHADSLLYIFDESKAVPDATFDAVEGAFSGAGGDTANEAFALAVSTPGEPRGRFYDIHAKKPGYEDWHPIHVTLEDAVKSHRISRQWAEQRRRQWGEDSAVYRNRVLGEFATQEEDALIQLSWVEAAIERWHEKYGDQPASIKKKILKQFTGVGVDVARSGADKTIRALRCGDVITDLLETRREDTMRTAGRVNALLLKFKKLTKRDGRAVIDVNGIGAGVVDRCREMGFNIVAFNGAEKSACTDKSEELEFLNKRAAAWWGLREKLDPSNELEVCLPPNDELIGELTTPKWKINSSGRIQVESKDDIRKRINRSTDYADAVCMIFHEEPEDAPVYLTVL